MYYSTSVTHVPIRFVELYNPPAVHGTMAKVTFCMKTSISTETCATKLFFVLNL